MHDPCGKFDNAKLSVGFTSHADQIQNALKAAQAGGLTAMLDAVNVALKEMKKVAQPSGVSALRTHWRQGYHLPAQ